MPLPFFHRGYPAHRGALGRLPIAPHTALPAMQFVGWTGPTGCHRRAGATPWAVAGLSRNQLYAMAEGELWLTLREDDMEMRQHLEQLEQALTRLPQALDGRPLRARCVQVLVSLLVVMYGVSVWAADAQGKYAAWDIGLVRCLDLHREMQDKGLLAFMHWFAGYLTALNATMPDTVSITGAEMNFGKVYTAWDEWLGSYCTLNPHAQVADAARAWTHNRYQARQTRPPQEVLPPPPVSVPARPPSR